MEQRGGVFLAENEDRDADGAVTFLATFRGYHDAGAGGIQEEVSELALNEAISWARARAARVWIRLADSGYYAAGEEVDGDTPPWQPRDLPELTRRRPKGEEWRDRSEDEPPIMWSTTVHLTPPTIDHAAEFDAIVERVAQEAGAAWSADALEAAVADIRQQQQSGTSTGWVTYHHPGYRLTLRVNAATAESARRAALDRVSAPEGWRAEPWVEARPTA